MPNFQIDDPDVFWKPFGITLEIQVLHCFSDNLSEAICHHSMTKIVMSQPWQNLSMQHAAGQHLRTMTK